MNHDPTGRAVHGQAGDTTGQVDTGDRVQEVHTPARAWTAAPPLPYRDDTNPPPHWFWGDIYKRMKRRPRCGEIVED